MQELIWNADRQCLRLDLSSLALGINSVEVSGWQDGLTWRTETQTGVVEEALGLETPGLEFLLDSQHADASEWRATIPPHLLEQANTLPFMRFQLLRAFALSNDAIRMFEQHSLLLMLWIDHCVRHEYSISNFRGGVGLSNRTLMFMMGLSSSKTALRVVKTFEGRIKQRSQFSQLSDALRDTALLENLQHETIISFALMSFLQVFPPLGGSNLSRWFLTENRREQAAIENTLCDMQSMAARLNESLNWRAIRQCSSTDALERIHDKLTGRFNARDCDLMFDVDYPAPPLEGNKHIVAITSGRGLIQEGREMRHCVGCYHYEVLEGRYYVYRIQSPERATLGVRLQSLGDSRRITFDQLKGIRNAAIREETRNMVMEWLQQQGDSNS